MNRRIFLFGSFSFNKNTIHTKPTSSPSIVRKHDGFVFVSKNKRFAHSIRYIEVDGCVKTQEIITWIDPFTKDSERVRRKTMLYITDVHNSI